MSYLWKNLLCALVSVLTLTFTMCKSLKSVKEIGHMFTLETVSQQGHHVSVS